LKLKAEGKTVPQMVEALSISRANVFGIPKEALEEEAE